MFEFASQWFWPVVFSLSAADLLLTVRWGLQSAALLPDTKPRIAASACALLICAALALSTPLSAAACFLSYLLTDLVVAAVSGPALLPEILLHHALCVVVTGAGLFRMVAAAPAERAAVEVCTAALLWMEAVNPFLHGLWYVSKEPGPARATPLWAKALLAATLLYLYARLRVYGCTRVALDVWGRHWEALGGGAPYFLGLVAGLATMQWVWWVKLFAMVVKGLRSNELPPLRSAPAAAGGGDDSGDDGETSALVKKPARHRPHSKGRG
jgi:hypothetical protein